ncbi:hypothetical protein NKH77_06225 [Streptomyces sp. M19]
MRGLPVALRVVACGSAPPPPAPDPTGRRTRRRRPSVGGPVPTREYAVSAVFDLAYRALPPSAARLYRLLGWLPVRTFDAGTAAVAAGVDAATVTSRLELLEEASLLQRTDDGRYRFHDLVRLHAGQRAAEEEPESERDALVARVTTHYLALTALADRAVREDRFRVADLRELLRDVPDPSPPTLLRRRRIRPLDWLEAERAAVLAVLRAAVRHGLVRRAWQLAEAFTVLFLHHRHLGSGASP